MKTNQMNMKEILSYILFAVLGLLIVFIVMLSAFPDMTLQAFGTRSYIAKYDTMEDTINPYDLVFINKINENNIKVGDLITFNFDIDYNGTAEMVTYYVYSVTDVDGLLLFEVNAEGSQIPVSVILRSTDIIGGYSFRIPFVGRIIEFIASPFGIAAILVNAGVIVTIVLLLKDNKKPTKKEETN